jgi:hypothetical protein
LESVAWLHEGVARVRWLHKSSKVLGRYVKRTQRQIIAGVEKRRALRPAPPEVDVSVQLELFRGDKGKR